MCILLAMETICITLILADRCGTVLVVLITVILAINTLSCLCMVEDEYDEEYRWFLRTLDY